MNLFMFKQILNKIKLTLAWDTFMGSLASKGCVQFCKSPVSVMALGLPPFLLLLKAENFHLRIIKSIMHLKHHTAVGMCITPGLRSVVGKEWSPRSRDESLELARSLVTGSCSDPEPNIFAVSIVILGRAMNAASEKTMDSVTEEVNG